MIHRSLTRRAALALGLLLAPLAAAPAALWDANPVVLGQEVGGVSDAVYHDTWAYWKELGYAPVVVGGTEKGSSVVWTGLWHKDPSIVAWSSKRGLTDAQYVSAWNQATAAGYRVLDLDAHVVSGQPRFNVIFVKDQAAKPFVSHRSLTLAQLDAKVIEYRGQGFRPIRVNGYRVGSQNRYAAVWVRDGLTDVNLQRDLTSAQYSSWWTTYKNQGYHPVDIAAYPTAAGLRFAGIWVRESVDHWISLRDRTAAQMQTEVLEQKKANYLLIDLDAYVVGGNLRFSGVWVRRTPRNVLTANVSLSGAAIAALQAKITAYTTTGGDGRKGSLGFYVEDLTTGHYLAYNPHEPFYLASAAKTFIAAKTVSMPEMPAGDLYQLRTSDWRGETTRGFTKSDIGDSFPVSEFLDHMIDSSDSASTDRLFGLISGFDGALAVNRFLDDRAAMLNVGEITSICQVDKRVQANADTCAFAVPCHSFESWYRAADTSYSTPADLACFGKLNAASMSTDRRYDLYYNSLANSVTPAEVGRFFRAVADHELLTAFDEGDLVRELDKNNSYAPTANGAFQAWGGKDGGKYKVKSWIGLAWNWDFGAGDYSSLSHQFSIALFTEDWTTDDTTGGNLAAAILGDVVKTAIPYLVSKRP